MGNGPFPRNSRKLLKIEMTDELDPEYPKFDSKKRKHPLYKVQLQLEGYLQELPVIGFNS
jgi:hypothetical protein